HKSGLFQVPQLDHWVVIVAGNLLKDVSKAPEHILSFTAAAEEYLQTRYTHGIPLDDGSYHIEIIYEKLQSSATEAMCSMLYEETEMAFKDYVDPQEGQDWTGVNALKTLQKMVTRINNRIWLGEAVCKDPQYLDVVLSFTVRVFIACRLINLFPVILKPLVGSVFSNYNPPLRACERFIVPIIMEREALLKDSSYDWEQLPDDMLTWMMRRETGQVINYRGVVSRMMNVNLASNHSTSMAICHILYELATRPKDVEVLREEILDMTEKHGRTSVAYKNMVKLDSYIKESLRLTGVGLLTGRRKALTSFTFSDGTTIPKNTFLSAPAWAIHHNGDIYKNPNSFDGFRFVGSSKDGVLSSQSQAFVSPSEHFIPFGIGKHIWCPGRFYAATLMKTVITHILENFDMKLATSSKPTDLWIGTTCLPNTKAK
ncbi:cytochrome P450, partial [Hysterangium stoloniferum]